KTPTFVARTYKAPMAGVHQADCRKQNVQGSIPHGARRHHVAVELLRPALQRDAKMGSLRHGAVPVEYQLAVVLRWLAGGSIFDGMEGHVIARSTAHAILHRVIDALNACDGLACKWPVGVDAFLSAAQFKKRSEHGIIGKALRAMDGLFVRLTKPTRCHHGASHKFFSGHKKGHGMNLQ
ncbi:unnamed protein product, partial [Laminaria digitata]